MTWRFATLEEARELSRKLKEIHGTRQWGEMNAQNLVVHGNPVDGAIYALPDSFYTVVLEIWFASPMAALSFVDGCKFFQSERGGHTVLCGYVQADASRWINALLQHGGQYRRTSIQIDWSIE